MYIYGLQIVLFGIICLFFPLVYIKMKYGNCDPEEAMIRFHLEHSLNFITFMVYSIKFGLCLIPIGCLLMLIQAPIF